MKEYNKEGLKFLEAIFILIVIISIPVMMYKYNKNKCEKAGGTYIFEFGNGGSKCHFKVQAK